MNFDNSFISFIVPVKNPQDFNSRCLKSIIKQKYSGHHLEIIIVNNSPDAFPPLEDNFIVTQELRSGPQFARNKGLSLAKGRYVAFIDCDVILEDNWLHEMMTALKSGDYWGAQSSLITTSSSESLFSEFRKLSSQLSNDGMIMAHHFFPVINTSACLLDRTKTGHFSFDESFPKCEDVEMSWKLFRKAVCSWIYVPNALASCYYAPESFSVFFKRNFHLGRYYGGLVRAYSQEYPSIDRWHDGRFFNSLNELGRMMINFPGAASLMRIAMSLGYWLGFYIFPKHFQDYKIHQYEKPHKRFTTIKDLTLIHDLETGSVRVRKD